MKLAPFVIVLGLTIVPASVLAQDSGTGEEAGDNCRPKTLAQAFGFEAIAGCLPDAAQHGIDTATTATQQGGLAVAASASEGRVTEALDRAREQSGGANRPDNAGGGRPDGVGQGKP